MDDDGEEVLYPWKGDFTVGDPESPVAVVTLSGKLRLPMDRIALAGPMKTENLGVEKVVANVISNPRIRFLVVAGEEVRGHRSGDTIVALHRSGVDGKGRVVGAKGAVPYIENLDGEALDRFREQVELVDMMGVTDPEEIGARADELKLRDPGSFGEPFIALEFTSEKKGPGMSASEGTLALHRTVVMDPYGEVSPFTLGADAEVVAEVDADEGAGDDDDDDDDDGGVSGRNDEEDV
jgi:tetrahydromethanopterin S-methyltransferase subunit A